MELLDPKEVEIDGAVFRIGKFPAVAGREIITKYPLSNIPRIGDYEVSEKTMVKLMSFVERVYPDKNLSYRLTTVELINNHVPSWETLVKLEAAALEHNCSFFQNGKSSNFFKQLGALAQQKVTEILTDLLAKSSQAGKQPSKN